jgi:hypothetical protein
MKPGDLVKFKPRSAHKSTESRCGIIIRDCSHLPKHLFSGGRFEVMWPDGVLFVYDEHQLEVINETG